jgi:hypothetical protein
MATEHTQPTRNPGVFGLLAMPMSSAYDPATDQALRPLARPSRTTVGGRSRIAVSALAARLRQLAVERRAAR